MRRILELEIIGNSRGAEAMLNRLNGSLTQTGSHTRRTTNELSLMDRQLMAIGTTARYALAGSLVFGITGAIARLQDFNNQLGVTAGLAGTLNSRTGQYTAPSQSFLTSVGDEAQLAANRVGIATDDVQSYMTRFYSTFSFQNPNSQRARSDMRGFVNEVTRLQALLGTEAGDPQQLAGGIAGFINQIPGGKRNISGNANRIANLISYLTASTPNITGRDISRDIGRIGATMNQTGMTPEQTFAIWAQAGKAGGSSSVIGRGVAQMLGSLLHPTTPAQIQAYQSIGLPTDPQTLRQMGAFNVFSRMLSASQTGKISARSRFSLNDENIDDPTAAIGAAGVRGINLNRVYGLFGRQESARQFVNLLAQGGLQSLKNYIRTQQRAADANAVYARETAALHQRQLARFTQARQNLSLSMARGIAWPLEHIIAPPVIGLSNVLAGSQKARIATDAVLGGLLLRATAKRFLGARRGGMGAAGAAITAEELPALVSGQGSGPGGAPLGTRADPIWVMISPASWFVGSPGGMASPVPPGKGVPGKGFFKKIIPWVAGAAGAEAGSTALAAGGIVAPLTVLGAAAYLGRNDYAKDTRDPAASARWQKALDKQYFHGGPDKPFFMTGALDVTTKLVDAQGRIISVQQHKGVPVKRWGASSSMPSSKGKPGSSKK